MRESKKMNVTEEATGPRSENRGDWETQSAELDRHIHIYQRTHAMADLEDAIRFAEALEVVTQEDRLCSKHLEILDTLSGLVTHKHSQTRSKTDLDHAISLNQRALQEISEDNPSIAGRMGALGQLLNFRYEQTADLLDLQEAIRLINLGLAAVDEQSHAIRALLLSDLGLSLHNRHLLTGDMSDLDDSTRFTREALDLTDQTDPKLPGRLNNLGNRIYTKYSITSSIDDLDESIALARQSIFVQPGSNPGYSDRLNNFAIRLGERYLLEDTENSIEVAIEFSRISLEVCEPGSVEWADRQHTFGSLLHHRYLRRHDREDLEDAISAEKKAIEAAPENSTTKARYLNTIGSRYGERHKLTNAASDLENAISLTKEALEIMPKNAKERSNALSNLANHLGQHYLKTQHMTDLEEAMSFAKLAVEASLANRMGQRSSGHLITYHHLADQKYSRTNSMTDLEEAARVTREAIDNIPTDHQDYALLLEKLGSYLDDRYYATETIEDLEGSLQFATQSLEATPVDHPNWPGRCNNVGLRLGSKYLRTGNMEDLERAIATSRRALEATPKGHENRPNHLNSLALNLGYKYSATGEQNVLSEAIQLAKETVAQARANHPERLTFLTNLGNRMADRFTHTGEISDLDEATRLAKEVLKATDGYGPRTSIRMNNVGERLRQKYLRTGNADYLNEAIEMSRKAVANDTFPMEHPDRAQHSMNLAVRLGDRYYLTGSMNDLEEAVTLAREAVQLTEETNPGRATILNTLGSLMGHRYSRTGDLTDLDEAIEFGRKAADIRVAGHPRNRAEYLNNLANRLSDRNSHTGALMDLEEAVKTAALAAEAIPLGHPDRTMYMNNLALHLGTKHDRTEDRESLDQAISVSREALKLLESADHPERAPILSTVGLLLSKRFSARAASHLDQDALNDIEEAIKCMEEASRITPKGRPDRVKYLSNIGNFAGARYLQLHQPKDLTKAIMASREAVEASPENHPDRATPLSNLGRLLRERGETRDLKEATKLFATVLDFSQAPIGVRIDAGRLYLATIDVVKHSEEAYEVARKTISMISVFAPVSLRPADKQYLLSQAVGLAPDAAAIALHVHKGHPAEALKLLETGRGIIAGSLQKMRTDLSELRRSFPELASSFEQLRDLLDRPSVPGNERSPPGIANSGSVAAEADARHLASARMDTVLSDIRRQPKFQDFLGAATEDQMREAADKGPIVVLNISRYTCVAIVIEKTRIRVLQLEKLTYAAVEKMDRMSVACLEWLWEVVVEPVLDFLEFLKTPVVGESWPHVWWIPTGPLVGFPLHAAGRHFGSKRETALDRVVSSYSSSIQALIYARQQPLIPLRLAGVKEVEDEGKSTEESDCGKRAHPNGNVVLVSMPKTPEKVPLQHATSEVAAVRQACQAMGLPCLQPVSRQEDVLTALNDSCRVFHFAGHGATHFTDPMESQLFLEDWKDHPLTVGDLLGTNLVTKSPFLAYLSACGTSQIRDNRAVDENIHLASAFQLAGFRHVVGTLWEVHDDLCVRAAKMTYQALLDGGMSDVSVSEGLHHTLRRLRDGWVQSKGYILTGQRQSNSSGDAGISRPKGFDDLVLVGQEASVNGNAATARTIAKTETDIRTPRWVPYVHFGP